MKKKWKLFVYDAAGNRWCQTFWTERGARKVAARCSKEQRPRVRRAQ